MSKIIFLQNGGEKMTQEQRDDLLISVAKGVNNLQIEVNEIRKDLRKTNEKVDENTVEIKKNRKMIEENTRMIEENTRMIEKNSRMIEENTRQIKEVKANLSNLEKFTYENFDGVKIVFQDFPEFIDKKMKTLEKRIENNENEIRNIKVELA